MGRLKEAVAAVELRRFEATRLKFDERMESFSPRKGINLQSRLKAKEWSVGFWRDSEVGYEIGSITESVLAAIERSTRN